jgi:hypothetical protein
VDAGRRGYWLDMRTGISKPDPAAEFAYDSSTGLVRTLAEPVLTGGQGGIFYSRTAKRWLPVPRNAVSPDGLRYAYAEGWAGGAPDRLRVVEIASGKETVFQLSQDPFSVFDFEADAVYLIQAWEGSSGLWRFDLATGKQSRVAAIDNIWAGDGESVWAGSVNPADPHPLAGMTTQPDQVDQITVRTGHRQPWLYRPVSGVYVMGLDRHGKPVVFVNAGKEVGGFYQSGDNAEIVVLDSPTTARTIYSGSAGTALDLLPTAIDEHGTWFGGMAGIYLLEDGAALRKVSAFAGRPAGGCI